ncbi:uncharacterized protein EV420DRAFT_843832 [Desarmillaria tabescens]|uniref:F-box domain-containing protein n=1 Tax=Armillaria tabescens TaxID=1929756 RepID=A0AA39JTV6_ARMTA|nr:uncharacterized protein EV420DRAFT_843832 [Desarmillaria tabescens]KAK0448452.1 hypothetical protein EV420DRAFT_843832 [Desarmillaria tabescens]
MSAAVQATRNSLDTLPLELVLKIFHMATFDEPDYNVPLALSHVSRGCRAVVSLEARLWTTIELNNKSAVRRVVAGADPQDVFPSLSVYLRNSGRLPLNLSIKYAGAPRDAENPVPFGYTEPCANGFTLSHATLLGSILARHAHRLARFTVHTKSWQIYTLIINEWVGLRLPLLESWDVEYGIFSDACLFEEYPPLCERDLDASENILTNNGNGVTVNQLVEIGQHFFPSLKRLRLSGTPNKWTFSASNLVELVLQNIPNNYRPTGKALQSILSNSQHTLQVLELNGVLQDNVNDSTQQLSLPAVHTLKVGFAYVDEIVTLLQIAEFPALTDLTLWHLEDCLNEDQRHQDEMVEIFQAMVDNLPLRQLTTLHMDAISFPREDLYSTLCWAAVRNGVVTQAQYPVVMRFTSELNALQTLTLVRPDPLFLQCMGYSPPSSMLFLPSLRNLRCETSIPKDCLYITKFWQRRINALALLSGGMYPGPGLERLELLLPQTHDSVHLQEWKDNPQPYAMWMGVEFQPEHIPFVIDQDDDIYMESDEDEGEGEDAMAED